MSDKESETKPDFSKQVSISVDKAERFKAGVNIKGKFFGVEDVKQETGDEVCQNAMIKLKAIIAVKKEHKQKLNIKVDLDGIQILDEATNNLLYKHSVNRISYIARDLKDPRAIGYIYKNLDDSYQYFGLRTHNQAQELFNLLKDLFEVVLELRSTKKKENRNKEDETKSSENKVEENLKEDLKEAQLVETVEINEKAPLVSVEKSEKSIDILASDNVPTEPKSKPVEEPSLFDLSTDVTPTTKPAPAMDDLFGLGDLTLDTTTASPSTPAVNSQTTPSFAAGNDNIFQMLNVNQTPSPAGVPQNQFNNAMMNQNTFTAMNGIPNMSQYPPQQQQFSAGYNPQFGLNNLSQYQATASSIQASRTAPVPPASTNKVPTNAFDDLFN